MTGLFWVNCGLSSGLASKESWSKDSLLGDTAVFGELSHWRIADVYCWVSY
jgi:hypothetical protein